MANKAVKVWMLVVWNDVEGLWEAWGRWGTAKKQVEHRRMTEVPCTMSAKVISIMLPCAPVRKGR